MIKINLKNTRTSISRVGFSETGLTERIQKGSNISTVLTQLKSLDLSQINPALLLKILMKMVFLFSIPFGLKIYEIMNIENLETQKKAVQLKIENKNSSIGQVQSSIDQYSHLKETEIEFNRKKSMLSSLAATRLIIPRFLDEVQTIIPPYVWLKSIEVNSENNNKRAVALSGEGVNEETINNFLESLKLSVDANSLQLNTKDIKEGENSTKVEFRIKAAIQN